MEKMTFGSFVREKRLEREMSLRGLAAKLGLSPVYMSNIENGLRPAPDQAKLEELARILFLNKEEREQLLDLAAKSRKKQVALDLPEYIMERDIVRQALRTAKELDATDKDWQDFIDRISQKGKREDG